MVGKMGENVRVVKASKANATRALLELPVIVPFVVSWLAYNKIRTNDNKEVQIKSQLELTAKWKGPQNYNHNDVDEGAGVSWERCQGCREVGTSFLGNWGSPHHTLRQIEAVDKQLWWQEYQEKLSACFVCGRCGLKRWWVA